MSRIKEIQWEAGGIVNRMIEQGFSENRDTYDTYYQAFQEGAKWADKTLIERACEWLKENAKNYIVNVGVGHFENEFIVGGKCWTDFRKAMEE